MKNQIKELSKTIKELPIEKQLSYLADCFQDKIAFSTSLGYEDQVISHIIFTNKIPIKVFTLDTGRLFEETYKTLQKTINKYKTKIDVYFPDNTEIENFVNKNGVNSFYESIENRKKCCQIRKVEPLKRALHDIECWITGLRARQSAARTNLPLLEWDETHQTIKFSPLQNWSIEEVKDFIDKRHIPHNPLHDKGFKSIGCAPCTRPVKEGEDIRAGRWWWEDNTKKECGLHIKGSGKNNIFNINRYNS